MLLRNHRGIKTFVSGLAAFVFACQAQAIPTALFDLGAPTVIPTGIEVDVILEFNADDPSNDAVNFFQLDVSNSSSNLTNGGTDYTRFSFLLEPGLIPDWQTTEDFAFNAPPDDSLSRSETLILPLLQGTYTLGQIRIDLTGLTPGSGATLSIMSSETRVTYQDISSNILAPLIDFGPTEGLATFTIPDTRAVPEPLTATLGLVGLGVARRRRAA